MGQILSTFFSWVGIHGIYYTVNNGNQIWRIVFFIKHIVYYNKWKWQKNKKIKNTINGYVYVENLS